MTAPPNSAREHHALADGVPPCAESRRIAALPRRTWTKRKIERAREKLHARFKIGSQSLWDDQVIALTEIGWYGGILGGLRVSGGKSLVAFLAASMHPERKRPLLIVPSKSIRTGKIRETYDEACSHWRLRSDLAWTSYEKLQRLDYAEYLQTYQPEIIICDEAHHIGRYDSSRTARMRRYLAEHPDTIYVALSGSLIGSRLVDDSLQLAEWALGDDSPLPKRSAKTSLRYWRMALESPPRCDPGVISTLGVGRTPAECLGDRYTRTPGVICSSGEGLGTALECTVRRVPPPAAITEAIKNVRRGLRPDGAPLTDADGTQAWRMVATLALGYYTVYDPAPPREWLDARSDWAAICRSIIRDESNHCDTELAVVNALEPGECQELDAWLAVKDSYKIQTKAVWLSEHAIEYAQAWGKAHKGLIWTQHKHFGQALNKHLPYYASHAKDQATKRYITQHKAHTPCAASIKVCSEDLNLQHLFAANLFISPPANGTWHEQAIARTHRFGQPQDTVSVEYLVQCSENARALDHAKLKEQGVSRMTKDTQRKLLIADWYREGTLSDSGSVEIREGAIK